MIDIKGLDKAAVLAALYNRAQPQGMGFLHFDPKPMTTEEAAVHLEAVKPFDSRFDYLKGRVMKVQILGDELYEGLYDRDNGQGAAARAIDSIRQTSDAR